MAISPNGTARPSFKIVVKVNIYFVSDRMQIKYKCHILIYRLPFTELVHGLVVSVQAALGAYKNANHTYPDRIVIYR